jgi:hypothetical protein
MGAWMQGYSRGRTVWLSGRRFVPLSPHFTSLVASATPCNNSNPLRSSQYFEFSGRAGEIIKCQVLDAKVKRAGKRMVGSFELTIGAIEEGPVTVEIMEHVVTPRSPTDLSLEGPAVTRPNVNGVCKIGIKSCTGTDEER